MGFHDENESNQHDTTLQNKMYCQGITRDGCPCTNKTKGKYCNVHEPKDGNFEDCPICYNPMQSKIRLRCGHSFCLPCLQNWSCKTCPMCRKKTNHILEKVQNRVAFIRYGLLVIENTTGKEKKTAKAHEIMKAVFTIHSYMFSPGNSSNFLGIFEDKILELESDEDFDATKYKKALASYYSRIKMS